MVIIDVYSKLPYGLVEFMSALSSCGHSSNSRLNSLPATSNSFFDNGFSALSLIVDYAVGINDFIIATIF